MDHDFQLDIKGRGGDADARVLPLVPVDDLGYATRPEYDDAGNDVGLTLTLRVYLPRPDGFSGPLISHDSIEEN